MGKPLVVVTFDLGREGALHRGRRSSAGAPRLCACPGWTSVARREALDRAAVLFAPNTGRDLRPGEAARLGPLRLVQFMTAGHRFHPAA